MDERRWCKFNFFHNCVKGRNKRNVIKAIKVEGGWVEKPFEVREAVLNYFRAHVSSVAWERLKLDGVVGFVEMCWLHFVKTIVIARCQTRYLNMLVRHPSVPCSAYLEIYFKREDS